MDFQQLKYVIEVANCGSINKAAEKLYVSQPNISKALLNLEKELNITIFNRNTNGVTLTKEGTSFILYAKSLIDQFKHIENMYKNPIEKNQKHLNIYTQKINIIYDVFYEFYDRVNGDYLEFKIKEDDRENVVEAVEKSMAELGFIVVTNVQAKMWKHLLRQKHIEFNELVRGVPCVYLGKNNLLAQRSTISLEELKNYTNVRFYGAYESSLNYNLELSLLGFEDKHINKKVWVSDGVVCNELINRIDGYRLGVAWHNANWKSDKIKGIPLSEKGITLCLGWIKKKNSELSEESKLFIELLKKRMGVQL